ncbi:MAG: hypothetical protein C0467_24675 [Planctomycetaceae bacterium]|nr:hypothetical protein [Planctomycetaceae bacterium]
MPESANGHPEPDRLTQFVAGGLPEDEAVAVAAHLADCETCRASVDAVPESDLARRLHSAHQSVLRGDLKRSPTPDDSAGPTVPAELADHPRYRIIGFIGAGGMGAVYKAEHKLMGRVVALKVIRRGLLSSDGASERFLREVRAAAQLSHPNIVQAFDADEASGLRFLVMEFVEGETLDHLVTRNGPLPQTVACEYIRQAALGLQHAHERGLTHRDVKPHNLILTTAGVVKILDFGLARIFGSGNADDEQGPPECVGGTSPGMVMGTVGYVAPEQSASPHAADCRADVYGLGATLSFLVTGLPPDPLGQLAERLPQPLIPVVARMLTPDPDHRFQTPGEVAEILVPLCGECGMRRSWVRRGFLAGVFCLVAIAVVLGQSITWRSEPLSNGGNQPPSVEGNRGTESAGLHKIDSQSGLAIEGRLMEGHAHPVVGVGFAADGSRLFSADASGEVRSWIVNGAGCRVFHVTPDEWTGGTAFFAPPVGGRGQSRGVLGGRDGALRVWDLADGRLVRRLKPDRGPRVGGGEGPGVSSVAFFPDGERVVVPADGGGIAVWNLDQRAETGRHWVDAMPAQAVTAHPDGQKVAYSTSGGEVRVCDLSEGRELRRYRLKQTHAVRLLFSPDGQLLAGGLLNGEVAVWHVETQTEKQRLTGGHRFPVVGLAFTGEGRLVSVSGADQAVVLWDAMAGKRISGWQSPRGPVTCVAATAGTQIACGSKDGAVWLCPLPP